MTREEQRSALREALETWAQRGYCLLVNKIGDVERLVIHGDHDREWFVEIRMSWDDKPGGDIRVTGTIDDGGIGAFFPTTDSVLVSP